MDLYEVTFEGNRLDTLSSFGIELYNHDFNALPSQIINKYKIARSNKSVITSAVDGDKQIPILFEICGGSRPETEFSMRYLKALLKKPNGALIANFAGQKVRWTATLNEFNHQWDGVTALVEVVFETSDPVGTEVSQTDLADRNITTQTASIPIVVGGSSEAFPEFYIYVVSVSGGTNQTMSITNSQTGQGLYITRNWVANDNVTISTERQEIIINGKYVDFTGIFPNFDTGPQTIGYSDTFTSRSINFVSKYNQKNA